MEKIQQKYNSLIDIPSDINEHLPTLYNYACECETIFETGVRGVISTWAFVNGLLNNNLPRKKILLNDINSCDIDELTSFTKDFDGLEIQWEWKNNLELEFKESFDLTFIDTWHIYGQLKRELEKFSKITNKYIIMHDTTIDEIDGETIRNNWNAEIQSAQFGFPVDEILKGLGPAIDEFLEEHPEWVLHEKFTNNNGLTILKKLI